ncbi:CBM9 family sugar-binding protein [Portibacter marinus]|uniref:CBM9 family sugar-binding protein n=1 Tax=Portibacter marinus TaxID=2898660 RepID=UPI001F158AF9|nr:CBM9 family sugar-binding protein [Portibacter marinus]
MKIFSFLLLFGTLLISSCALDSGMQFPIEEVNLNDHSEQIHMNSRQGQPLKVFKAPGFITIDGIAEEWSDVPPRKMREELNTGFPIEKKWDLSGTFQMLWDENHLYFFATILDQEINVSGEALFEKDGLEIYIDGDNSKNEAAPGPPIVFPPPAYDSNDEFIRFVPGIPDPLPAWGIYDVSNISFEILQTENGYNVEISMPFSDLPDFPAQPGHEFGLELQLNDNDGGQRQNFLKWFSGLDHSYYDPSTFGTAVLFDSVAE